MALPPAARILVIKLATAGDLLLATPALRALRTRYPAAQLDLLTTTAGAALLADSPLLDHIYTLESSALATPVQIASHPLRALGVGTTLLRLRRTHYDAALLLHHLTLRAGRLKHRALLAALAAHYTIGLDNGHGSFLDVRVPDSGFGVYHEAEYALALAASLQAGAPAGARGLRPADLGWDTPAPRSATPTRPPLVALHPGSGNYSVARRWPPQRFAALAQALHSACGARVLLVGGEDEHAIRETIMTRLGRPAWVTSAPGAGTPRVLAATLGACDLFIGNDSFPMHLATAVGVPVVAIFGPSNAQAWGPYAPDAPRRAVVVRRADLRCSPCLYRGHALGTPQGCPPRPCLNELGLSPVLAAARRLLLAGQPSAAPAG